MLVYQGVYFYKYLQINLEIVNLDPFSQDWDVRIPGFLKSQGVWKMECYFLKGT